MVFIRLVLTGVEHQTGQWSLTESIVIPATRPAQIVGESPRSPATDIMISAAEHDRRFCSVGLTLRAEILADYLLLPVGVVRFIPVTADKIVSILMSVLQQLRLLLSIFI